MKNYIIVFVGSLSLFALNAVACPDLSGIYATKTIEDSKQMEIQMSTDGFGATTLSTGGPFMVIDGKSHTVPGAPASYIASCTDSDISVHFFQGSNEVGSLHCIKTTNGFRAISVGMENSDETYVKVH
jgi:hypothetical protein